MTVAILLSALALAAAPASSRANETATVSELIVTASKTVAELTVTAPMKCLEPDLADRPAERPKVVSSFPAKGAVVRRGLLVVRITFDRPMTCHGGFVRDPPLPDPCPTQMRQMLLSYDRKTVRTVCLVEPGVRYGMGMSLEPNGSSFIGLSGLPSMPYKLSFTTSAATPVTNVCEALAEDDATAREIRARRPLDCAAPPDLPREPQP